MDTVAVLVLLNAKPGKDKEVEQFLELAQPLALREPGTSTWYAVKLRAGSYGIFDTFKDDSGRNAHFNGEIAKALFERASDLFSSPPHVEKLEILASKAPNA